MGVTLEQDGSLELWSCGHSAGRLRRTSRHPWMWAALGSRYALAVFYSPRDGEARGVAVAVSHEHLGPPEHWRSDRRTGHGQRSPRTRSDCFGGHGL